MAQDRLDLAEPEPTYYMRLLEPHVDARLGKMVTGQVVAVNADYATGMLRTGIAEQVSSAEMDEQRERRQKRASAREQRFAALNDQYAMWDVSTYRDVLTAP